MPLQATSGAASYDGFGGGAAAVPNYIEEVFSTYLYAGNSGTQSIVNGIDLSTKGGLVWVKNRGVSVNHQLSDTVNGMTFTSAKYLRSNLDSAISDNGPNFQRADSVGFTWGTDSASSGFNLTGNNYVSWTFREQPKFFDIVTYTGTGSNTTIAHNLGSVPGSIIVKRTNSVADWAVYHRSLANTQYLVLNTTAAAATGATWWNSTTPTSTVFSLGTDASVNASGGTYVAYLFAHDAGGFGLTGTDNVISCGSFTSAGPSTDVTVTLGYEPQWIMQKNASVSADWEMYDVMRGMSNTNTAMLRANKSDAEADYTVAYFPRPTATGFIAKNSLGADAGNNIIYIAIRRGPMKVPTLGTSVFSPVAYTGNGSTRTYSAGFPTDLSINMARSSAGDAPIWNDRLRGNGIDLYSDSTSAEQNNGSAGVQFDNQTNIVVPSYRITNGTTYINWVFKRAPGFFDEVCYTGNYAGNPQVPHNLGVAPEMLIARSRVSVGQWYVKHIGMSDTEEVYFNAGALSAGPTWVRTSTYWQYSSAQYPNDAHVAYLFATLAGVSKVGSYTGTGTTKQIDCGFTGGARFVLIKKTSGTGSWYVWDSARGIVSGNDPYLLLNSTAAEVTNTDYIDTYSAGFEISSTAPSEINENGGSFIFLAIS